MQHKFRSADKENVEGHLQGNARFSEKLADNEVIMSVSKVHALDLRLIT